MRCYYLRLRYWPWALAVVLALGSLLALRLGAERRPAAQALSPLLFERHIVVDAGHGGRDPGVVGISGALEKDIDLRIALKLGELLRMGGASVTLTREQDLALDQGKAGDLAARVQIAAELTPAAFISVHGNSFPAQPSVHGAQVFYFSANQEGQALAKAVQEALNRRLTENRRTALPHKTAYILKHISAPAVVVEVGFLSNAAEEALLLDEDHQWRMAWAIYDGLLDYLAAASAGETQLELREE